MALLNIGAVKRKCRKNINHRVHRALRYTEGRKGIRKSEFTTEAQSAPRKAEGKIRKDNMHSDRL